LLGDEKLKDLLAKVMFIRRKLMIGVRDETGTKYDSKIGRCHKILFRFASKNGQEVENIKEEILVRSGHTGNQVPVCGNDPVMVEGFLREDVAKVVIHVERDDRFGHLSEVSSENTGDIVGGVVFAFPVEGLSVAGRCLECRL